MYMGVEPACQLHALMECLPTEARESFSPKLEAGIDELDVWPFAEGVVNYSFVFVDGDRAGGIDDDAASR